MTAILPINSLSLFIYALLVLQNILRLQKQILSENVQVRYRYGKCHKPVLGEAMTSVLFL